VKKTALCLLLLVSLIAPAAASSSDSIPNSKLRVTVQQKAGGKIINGFHVLELICLDGTCTLSYVSLNQCGEAEPGKQAFYPKVSYSSTALGNLKVRNEGHTLVVQETGSDMIGDYVSNLRFEYEPVGEFKTAGHLTGFSGDYVKNSPGLKKVFALEYVPLPKASQIMKLDCGVHLPGIEKK
jgi:hypothetical protein